MILLTPRNIWFSLLWLKIEDNMVLLTHDTGREREEPRLAGPQRSLGQ